MLRKLTFCLLFVLACLDMFGQVDRIELGYQTTRRGIVWYRPGLPTHNPQWKFSRDTNAVLWVDTLTAIRYDWNYSRDVWCSKGTFSGATPPLPMKATGSVVVDNRQAFWIRDTFNLLHKYDSTANAWTPIGDFFYLSNAPTDITTTSTHGAAKYRRSLWQDADNNLVYFWNGSAWTQFASGSGDNWGSQVVQTTARLSGNGTSGSPLDIAQQSATTGQALTWNGTTWVPQTATDNSATNELQTISVSANTVTLSNSGGSVTIAGAGINTVGTSGTTITVTGTEVDGNISNEGTLGVSAGVSTTSVITSNTSGANGVTLSASTGLSISESTSSNGGTITLTNTAPDQTVSISGAGINVATGTYPNFTITGTEVDGNVGNEGLIGVGAGGASSSVVTSNTSGATGVTINAAGIITISESTSSNGGSITLTGTEVDGSASNEIQALSAGGSGPSYTVDLSLSGGSVTLTPGTGMSLSRSGNTITITSTVSPGGNGIYGGSGSLPAGGSNVTIPNATSGLDFLVDASAGSTFDGIRVITDYCNDDAYTYYFTGKSPLDSFKIMSYDCGTILGEVGGQLTVSSDRELLLSADSINIATVPAKTTLPAILGVSATGWVSKISGTSTGQIPKWNNTLGRWELGTDNTGGAGTVTGTGTANRVAYWTSSTNIAADDDLFFDATNVGVGTTTMTGKFNINAGSAFTPLPFNAYASATSGGVVYGQLANTNTATTTVFSLNEQADVNTIRAGIRRYGSTHATLANQFDIFTIGSAPVTITTNSSVRFTVDATGTVYSAGILAAGFSSTTGTHSTLQSAGSFASAYLETVGAPTFDATKNKVVYTGTTNVSWTLPTASTCTGREYILHHANTSGTITLSQSVTSGNGANFNTIAPGQWAWITSTGSGWRGYKQTSL